MMSCQASKLASCQQQIYHAIERKNKISFLLLLRSCSLSGLVLKNNFVPNLAYVKTAIVNWELWYSVIGRRLMIKKS